MFMHSRFVFLSGVLLFVLLASLVCPTAVFADDGTPPPTVTEEPAQPPAGDEEESEVVPEAEELEDPAGDGVAATEVPVVEEAAVTEAPVVAGEVEDAATEPPAVTEEGGEEVTIGEVLEAAPEGTQIVVLDENGEALPLVSVEAAEFAQSGDPMWCPAGASPTALAAGCTDSYSRLADLLNFLITFQADPTYDQAGVIWIRNDYNSSTAEAAGVTQFVMQGGAPNPFSHMSPYALTIQGGWTGDSAGSIDHGDPSTLDGDALQIINWSGDVTINDVEFLDTSAIGLLMQTQGDITLSNVDANGNAAMGADLNSGGNIDIRSSTFGAGAASGNGLFGLNTTATGSTTLVDVTTRGNGVCGAILGDLAVFGGPVTVSESHFDGNGAIGLAVMSDSLITLSNVTASDNTGMVIGLAGASLIGDGPITVTESHFDGNGYGGLLVSSGSDVSLSAVTANGNESFGASLGAAGNVSVSQGYFDWNTNPGGEAFGLGIGSDQSITLDHVSASNNEGGGAILDTFENATVVCSQFQNNAGIGADGFFVDGTFTLNDVTFGSNGLDYDGTPVFMGGGCRMVSGKNHKLSALPLHVVPVSSGEQVELNCSAYRGTNLILPNGDRVVFLCPLHDYGQLTAKDQAQLPELLDDKFGFVSALEAGVIHDGQPVSTLDSSMIVDFVIPDSQKIADLAILRWDAEQSQWVEVPEGYKTSDGRFVATSAFTGVYVLVIK